MMTWRRILICNLLFFFIFILIFSVFVSACPCCQNSWVSSMSSWSAVKVVSSEVFFFMSHVTIHLEVFVVRAWSRCYVVLIKVFKHFFFSFFNMTRHCCFWNSWNLRFLLHSLKIRQNLSFQLQMLILHSLNNLH